jgi:predicted  nucleic acid-binding Zn-ribbon protein
MKKLTRRQLRKMILNEMRMARDPNDPDRIMIRPIDAQIEKASRHVPDRSDHIRGIRNKMHALESELERQSSYGAGSPAKMQQLASIQRKLDRLKQELDHLVDDTRPAAY